MNQKVAFITGASSGIGSSIASSLKVQGRRIISPTHKELDLNDLAAVIAYTKTVRQTVNRIDTYIHVAGIWHDANQVFANKKLCEFDPEQVIAAMDVGVTSAMLLCGGLRPILQNATVIGISGTFSDGGAGWLPYYTSKRALEDFLVGLSQDDPELMVFGISPADTATPAYQKFYPEYAPEAQTSVGVADLVLRLLSDEHVYKSGDIIEFRQGRARRAFHA